jgi:hypothetical protein
MNQSRKNVRSTKTKQVPFEIAEYPKMKGKKVHDVYIKTYDVCETMLSDQTGKFLTRSRIGNKYILIMVEIDSSAILVEPMKSRKDAEMIRAYNALLLRLKQAGISPKNMYGQQGVPKKNEESHPGQLHTGTCTTRVPGAIAKMQ